MRKLGVSDPVLLEEKIEGLKLRIVEAALTLDLEVEKENDKHKHKLKERKVEHVDDKDGESEKVQRVEVLDDGMINLDREGEAEAARLLEKEGASERDKHFSDSARGREERVAHAERAAVERMNSLIYDEDGE